MPENSDPDRKQIKTKSDNQAAEPDKKLDRDLVRYTRWLAIFTAALVFAAGLQFWAMNGQLGEMRATRLSGDQSSSDQIAAMKAQAAVMQGQLDEMRAEQRPWVYADQSLEGDITFDGQNLNVGLSLILHNTGRLPALFVWARAESFSKSQNDLALRTKQDALCAEMLRVKNFNSLSVFPGQSPSIFIGAPMRANEIALESGPPELERPLLRMVTPFIAGCITYQDQAGFLHQTKFAWPVIGGITIGKSLYTGGIPLSLQPMRASNWRLAIPLGVGDWFGAN